MENTFQENYEYRYKSVLWTQIEKTIRNSRETRSSLHGKYSRSFNEAFLLKMKRSIFGCFIDIFNSQQNQDEAKNIIKLSIVDWEMKSYSPQDLARFEKNNEFVLNGFQYLRNIISEGKPVTLHRFMEINKYLRLEANYVRNYLFYIKINYNLTFISVYNSHINSFYLFTCPL